MRRRGSGRGRPAEAGGRWRRASGWSLAALLLLVPLLTLPQADDPFHLPKRVASETLGLGSLLLLALAAIRADGGPWRLARPWPRVATALAPLIVVVLVSALASPHPLHAREALGDFLIGAACLVGWSLGFPAERLHRHLELTAVPAALLGLVGLSQALGFHGIVAVDPGAAAVRGADVDRLRISSLAGTAGDLGAYLVLPALLAQWRLARGGRRPLWAVALTLSVAGLVASRTITALAAVAVGSVLLWLLQLRGRRRLAALTVGLVLATLALGVGPLGQRVRSIGAAMARGDLDTAVSGRLDGWATALWMLEAHPWSGVGHGGYRASFATAKLALAGEGRRFYTGHVFPTFVNAHNDLLEAAAEWGWPGLLILAWALWQLAVAAARPPPGGVDERPLIAAGLVALLVLALGYFPFRLALTGYPAVAFVAWVLARDRELP